MADLDRLVKLVTDYRFKAGDYGSYDRFKMYIHRNYPQYDNLLSRNDEMVRRIFRPKAQTQTSMVNPDKSVALDAAKASEIDKLYAGKEKNIGDAVTKELGSAPKTGKSFVPVNKAAIKNALGRAAVYGAAMEPGIRQGIDTVKNWNAPGSNMKTRILDITGTLGGLGAGGLSAAAGLASGHPIVGSVAGNLAADRLVKNNASSAQVIRNMNAGNSVGQLTPEQQTAVDRYYATGISGQNKFTESGIEKQQDLNAQELANYENSDLAKGAEDIRNNTQDIGSYNPNPQIAELPPITPTMNAGQVNPQNSRIQLEEINPQSGYTTGQAVNMNYGNYNNTPMDARQNFDQSVVNILNPQFRTGYEATPEELALQQQVLSGENYVSQPEMYNRLIQLQQAQQNAINNDYRYQGDVIPAQGYSYDKDKLARLQQLDEGAAIWNSLYGGGRQGGAAQQYLDNQRIAYEQQIAAQAGVPYSQYAQAMADKQANDIKAAAQNQINTLTFQANQTSDRKAMLEYLQKAQEVKLQADRDIRKAYIDAAGKMSEAEMQNAGNLGVANTAGQYRLAEQQMQNNANIAIQQLQNSKDMYIKNMELNDANAKMKAAGAMFGGMAYMSPQQLNSFLMMFSQEDIKKMFGRNLTPQELSQFLNLAQSGNSNGMTQFWKKIRGIE